MKSDHIKRMITLTGEKISGFHCIIKIMYLSFKSFYFFTISENTMKDRDTNFVTQTWHWGVSRNNAMNSYFNKVFFLRLTIVKT